MEFHPLCKEMPELSPEQYADLKRDILANGLASKIVVLDGMILDGRNRYRACTEIGISPKFIEWGEIVKNGYRGSPLSYVISSNVHRRHLSESQRACFSLAVYDEETKKTKQDRYAKIKENREKGVEPRYKTDYRPNTAVTASKLAPIFGVGRGTIMAAVRLRNASPKLFEKVKMGQYINGRQLTINHALNSLGKNLSKEQKMKVRSASEKIDDSEVSKVCSEQLFQGDQRSMDMFTSENMLCDALRKAVSKGVSVSFHIYISHDGKTEIIKDHAIRRALLAAANTAQSFLGKGVKA